MMRSSYNVNINLQNFFLMVVYMKVCGSVLNALDEVIPYSLMGQFTMVLGKMINIMARAH